MTFNVAVLDRARNDAEGIYEWIAERSDAGALNWAGAYASALLSLRHNPDSNPLRPKVTLWDSIFDRSFSKRDAAGATA